MEAEITKLLVDQVVRKGRERYLDNMAKAFVELYDIEKNISHAKLTSAEHMSDAEVESIKAALAQKTGSSIDLEIEVDPTLIGGFILKYGDNLFDGSVKSNLRKLRRTFDDGSHIKKM